MSSNEYVLSSQREQYYQQQQQTTAQVAINPASSQGSIQQQATVSTAPMFRGEKCSRPGVTCSSTTRRLAAKTCSSTGVLDAYEGLRTDKTAARVIPNKHFAALAGSILDMEWGSIARRKAEGAG
ncbi:hypothetical protein RB195_002561 [Necator americanus]|uniref:Uncharacterized protein n=1 Tax=Necator americanus TaxID=51031 RepID=A0ABR1DKD7_NECAM